MNMTALSAHAVLLPLVVVSSALAQQQQAPYPPPAPQTAPAPQNPSPPPGNYPPAQDYPPPPQGYPPPQNNPAPPTPNYPPPPNFPPSGGYPQPPPPAYPPPNWQPYNAQPPNVLRYHPLRMQIEGGYTLTENDAAKAWHDGGNLGLGLTWFPSSVLPLGLRIDGSYSRFGATLQSLNDAAQSTGTDVVYGHQNIYGGDADVELDLPMGPHAREYFFGGFGWYREQTVFKQASYESGLICGFYYCAPGYFWVISTAERTTTPWLHSWNAGLGFEFAVADPVTFFVEARYLRIEPYGQRNAFIPIRVGLRF